MATLSAGVTTLTEVLKRIDPDGKHAEVGELLTQTNDVLPDMHWKEGNDTLGERLTFRTSLPNVDTKLLGVGTTPSASTTANSTETMAIIDGWWQADKDTVDINGNSKQFRTGEALAFTEAMNQKMTNLLFYGNSGTTPKDFTGIMPRYASLTGDYSDCMLNAGGTGSDNSSILFTGWGPNSVYGIYPKGSKAGLDYQDKGIVTSEVNGKLLDVYREHWEWKCGLAVKDWRYIVRICNIDISDLTTEVVAAPDLPKLMLKAIFRVPSLKLARFAWYMNRTTFEMFTIQCRNDVMAGGGLTYQNVDGQVIYSYQGFPIRICDKMTEAETLVS